MSVNNHMKISRVGLDMITSFEGAPRYVATRCEGDAWEMAWGVTFHPDGRSVEPGETCTHEDALEMFAHAIDHFQDDVRRECTRPLTQFQFDAFVSLAYNIGVGNFSPGDCSALDAFNAGREEEVPGRIARWLKTTSHSPSDREMRSKAFLAANQDILKQVNGVWRWVDANGAPCRYRRAMPGLLRRRYAEGCVFLGYDWKRACGPDKIPSIQSVREMIPDPDIAGKMMWADDVRSKTPFTDIERIAKGFPLEDPSGLDLFEAPPVAGVEGGAQSVPLPNAPPSPSLPAIATPPFNPNAKPPSVYTVAPDQVPYVIDPGAGLKPLEDSDRANGYVYQTVGAAVVRVASLGAFGTGAASISQAVEKDPVLMQTLYIFIPIVAVAVMGFATKAYGDWKRTRGETAASQGLF